MTILVCGGAGYIGSHMTALLVEKGFDTIVVDSLEKGHRAAVWPGATFYQADLRDTAAMDDIFTQHRIDAVVHFAADMVVPESVAEPAKYYNNNVLGTLRLLETMHKHGVKRLVFSSTAATYGEPERVPITEDVPTLPINPYGETKLAAEKIFRWFDGAYGLKYVALRYFNVAGAHPTARIGEAHDPETHMIPMTLFAAMGKIPQFTLFGEDYPTADGSCVRDYVHVMDLADAHLLALEKLCAPGEVTSAVYNLGSETGFSNKEIIAAAKKVTGKDFPVTIKARRPGDPPVLIASSEKIRRELGWAPSRTNIETIIQDAWAWHTSHPKGYN